MRKSKSYYNIQTPPKCFILTRAESPPFLHFLAFSFLTHAAYLGMYSRLRSNPYASSALKALAWFPVVVFFVDHGFSYASVEGRSMQVRTDALDITERVCSFFGRPS
jgi:hypothetical protein